MVIPHQACLVLGSGLISVNDSRPPACAKEKLSVRLPTDIQPLTMTMKIPTKTISVWKVSVQTTLLIPPTAVYAVPITPTITTDIHSGIEAAVCSASAGENRATAM
uniref:Uncharacterized protein n=1 Tax=Arion vulgaris TaxID=1028688 RepID=A0A0B7AFM0_9EUPU